jgi:hypothetical protein
VSPRFLLDQYPEIAELLSDRSLSFPVPTKQDFVDPMTRSGTPVVFRKTSYDPHFAAGLTSGYVLGGSLTKSRETDDRAVTSTRGRGERVTNSVAKIADLAKALPPLTASAPVAAGTLAWVCDVTDPDLFPSCTQ